MVRIHILPYLGNKRLIRIKRPEIKRWMNHYADLKDPNGNDVYSSGSKYLSVLKAYSIFSLHDMEILDKDPTNTSKNRNELKS
ncbi:hypothetical protein [Fictibacillus sp. S7]|uniref:hypothetical protein n=1 Tax=Fictibacillus sp. S7 TaxID=2212476 RepID=UPI001012CB66|nr:hypothetical protein DMO16_22600 [Fictibacillus sp. S7]